MGRVLGTIEDESGFAPLCFIHCETAGCSFPVLFHPDFATAARDAYNKSDTKALYAIVPARSKLIRVVKKLLPFRDECLALATDDRLLWPKSNDDAGRTFLEIGGVLHVAHEVDGGLYGHFDDPICNGGSRVSSPADKSYQVSDFFGKSLSHLCPLCVAKLTEL